MKVLDILVNNRTGEVRTIVAYDPRTKFFWFANDSAPLREEHILKHYTPQDAPAPVKKVTKKKVTKKKATDKT